MAQIVVMAEAEIDPGSLDRMREAGRRMIEASRREVGCITYAYSFDLLQPNRMRVIEVWASPAALREHFATPHMAQFRQDLTQLKAKIVSLDVYGLGEKMKLPS